MTDGKQPFLVCYDYGMGGLWGFMLARSEDDIRARYPELDIVHARPHWMTDEIYARTREIETHDVDGPVDGLLKAVVADRRKS